MSRSRWTFIALVAPLWVACGSSMPPAVEPSGDGGPERRLLTAPDAVVQPGERLRVSVQLRGIPAGELTASVGSPCRLGARRAVPVRAAGRSTALVGTFRDVWVDVQSLIDLDSGQALQTSTHKKLRRPLLIEVERTTGGFRWRKRRHSKPAITGERELPAPAHDVQSFVAMLRSWRPDVRPEGRAYVLVDRRLWLAEVMFRGFELLDAPGGRRPAARVDGVAQRAGRDGKPSGKRSLAFSLWVADDPSRAPLRLVLETRYGEVRADLVEYRRGVGDHGARSVVPAQPCQPVAEVSVEEIEEKAPPADVSGLPAVLRRTDGDRVGPRGRPVR